MSYYDSSTVPEISAVWSEDAPPLNQAREMTREDIRRITGYPVSLESLGTITRQMNMVAELSVPSVTSTEILIAEYKELETKYNTVLAGGTSGTPWDGPAPLKKADVVEYDTSLLASENWVQLQTQGLTGRMGQIKQEIMVTLGLAPPANGTINGQGRLYRS
jgi:hypothetical protein